MILSDAGKGIFAEWFVAVEREREKRVLLSEKLSRGGISHEMKKLVGALVEYLN